MTSPTKGSVSPDLIIVRSVTIMQKKFKSRSIHEIGQVFNNSDLAEEEEGVSITSAD